jgi:hypothetical protein
MTLITGFLSHRTFKFSIKREVSTRREMQTRVPQGYVLFLITGVYLAISVDDNCMYVTDCKEAYVLRKLQRDLNSTESWCEGWNIEINDSITQTTYFCHRRVPVEVQH